MFCFLLICFCCQFTRFGIYTHTHTHTHKQRKEVKMQENAFSALADNWPEGVKAKYSLSALHKLTFSSVCLNNGSIQPYRELLEWLFLARIACMGSFETTDLPQTWRWCVWELECCWASSTDPAWLEAAVSWCSWASAPCPDETLSKNNHRIIGVKRAGSNRLLH